MAAWRLSIGFALLMSMLIAAPARAATFVLGPAQGVAVNSGSQPNFFEVPFPAASGPNYEGLFVTERFFTGPQDGQIKEVRVFTGSGAMPIDDGVLLTYVDQGSNINVITVTPLGALAPGFNQLSLLSPVVLHPGEGIGIALRSNASSGSMEMGAFDVPGVVSYFTPNFPGTTGVHPKAVVANNTDMAVAVSGVTQGPYDSDSVFCRFDMKLAKRTPAGNITGEATNFCPTNVVNREDLDVLIRIAKYDLAQGAEAKPTFTLKPKRVHLEPDETRDIRLKWKQNAKTVKQITEILEESKKARKEKLVLKAKVTYPDGRTDIVKEKTKLKP